MANDNENTKDKRVDSTDIFEKEEKKDNFFLEFMKKMNSEENNKEEDKEKTVRPFKSSVKLQMYVVKVISKLNEQLDYILNSNRRIRWLSLVLAAALYLIVNGGINISKSNYYEILRDVPVQIEGGKDLYEIVNAPDTVVMNIYGNYIDVQATKMKRDYYAYIDVSNLSEGTHTVEIKAGNIPNKLECDIKPETVEITIAKKVVQTFDLKYEFINEQTDSMYTVHQPVLDFNTVKIRASQQTLDKIDRVVAIIDANITESKTKQVAKIVAYDANGEQIDVEINPKEVSYSITVSSYSKKVSLSVDIIGSVDTNYGIKSTTYQPIQIEIYGIEEEISGIEEIKVSYDVSNLKETTDFNILVKDYLPSTVRKASIAYISGTVEIEQIVSKEIKDIPITIINNANNYDVTFAGNNGNASIKITGLKSKVNEFSAADVQAYIDLKDVVEGTNEMTVRIIISDVTLNWEWVSNEKISVIVKAKGQ